MLGEGQRRLARVILSGGNVEQVPFHNLGTKETPQ
jgi:hypothetical protein